MSRLHITVGTRFLLNQQVMAVCEVLPDRKFILENQSFGGKLVYSLDDLIAAWGRGDLIFEVRGKHTKKDNLKPLITEYTIADFQGLPEKQQQEAWRRYEIISPLLKIPRVERTRKVISEYINSVWGASQADDKPPSLGKTVSYKSIERWINAFEESMGDIRSLVPGTQWQGGQGQVRINANTEKIIESVLAECRTARRFRTVKEVYLMVVNRIADENKFHDSIDKIPLPSMQTIARRINKVGAATVLRRQASMLEEQANASVQQGTRTTRILEEIQIDHSPIDCFVVDMDDRLPIGRPYLTLAQDKYSRMPFGFFLGFEPPSYLTVMKCLEHGILPKEDCQQVYGTEHSFPVYGLPEKLVTDRGKEFVGHDLKSACNELGIILEHMPPRKAWFKPFIERQFKTNNTGLIHGLPGTTLSNIFQRGDYDPAKDACISLSGLIEIIHIYFLDIYAQDWHKGLQGIPAKRWAESIDAGFIPQLPHSAEEIRIRLRRSAERTLGRSGIEFETLFYQSPELARLRAVLQKNERTVRIKYDPDDISYIYIKDPARDGGWIRVDAVDQEYTNGLSLYKHRAIREYVLSERKEVDIYELAAAKRHLQQIVEREFNMTKKAKGRKNAARFLRKGSQDFLKSPLISTTSIIPDDIEPDRRADNFSSEPSNLTSLPDDLNSSEWKSGYSLPPSSRSKR
ncbi:MAG: DDE-type integrase/transposase/recombinase [Anaerolineae bacterium]|nr:DDE-type integrase/transposase/recombinase [Anaerolineae bacterium]